MVEILAELQAGSGNDLASFGGRPTRSSSNSAGGIRSTSGVDVGDIGAGATAQLHGHSLESGHARRTHRLHVTIALEYIVDDAAIETVHWLEAEGLARLADALGDSAESRNELAALIGAVALDIDDNALRGFLGRVGQPVHEKLEVFEGMALATDQAADRACA